MGNFQFAHDFWEYADFTTVTPRTENASYPALNVFNLWKLGRHFRAQDVIANNYLLKLYSSSVKNMGGFFLDDVNFSSVSLYYSDLDSGYTLVGTYSVSFDERVQRYKIYIPVSNISAKYWMIWIPTGATALDSLAYWRIGRLACFPYTNLVSLAQNIAYPYTYSVDKAYNQGDLPYGGRNRVSLSSLQRYSGEMSFGMRTGTKSNEVWNINKKDNSQPLLIYENRGYTQYGYLCLRDSDFQCSESEYGVKNFHSQTIKFTEII